jgi:uncharacterized UBP type Zn finger protein
MLLGQNMTFDAAVPSSNGSAPRCEHLDSVHPVVALPGGCRDCQAGGGNWVRLVGCLTCGWVACSDDSPGQHARAHYDESDHPLARALEPGSRWTWCYVHQRRV